MIKVCVSVDARKDAGEIEHLPGKGNGDGR